MTCSDLIQGAEVATSLFLSRACAASVAARGAWPPHGPPLPSASSGSRRYVLTCSLTCKRGLWMVEKDGKRWKKSFEMFPTIEKGKVLGSNVLQCGPMWSTCLRSSSGCIAISPGWRGAESRCSSAERTAEPEIRCLSSHSAATRADVWLLTIEIL